MINQEDSVLKQTINQPAPNYNLKPSFEMCPQCGTYHPSLKPGEKCPVAPIKSADNKMVDINNFLSMLKNIIESQVSKKGIKDPEKMVKQLIVNITIFLENYNE